MATPKFTPVTVTPVGREPAEQSLFNNPVLTRRTPKGAANSWAMLVPLAVLIILGAGYWAYAQLQPAPLTDNTPVAAAPAAEPVLASAPAPAPALPVQQAVAPPVATTPPVAPAQRQLATTRAAAPVRHRAAVSASSTSVTTDTTSTTTTTSATTPPAPVEAGPPPAALPDAGPTIAPPAPSSGAP